MTLNETAKQLGIKGASAMLEVELKKKVDETIKAMKEKNSEYVISDKVGGGFHCSASVLLLDADVDDIRRGLPGKIYFKGESIPHNVVPPAMTDWIRRGLVVTKEDYAKTVKEAQKEVEKKTPELKR